MSGVPPSGDARRELVTLVSPVYCEEENLERFYEELMLALRGADFDVEILFVNDGSRDATPEILAQLAERDPRVRVLTFSRNFGALAAMTAGLYHASGEAVVVMSVDLQDPPSLIRSFVDHWREGYDIVWGVRDARDDPALKTLLARGFYWVIRRLAFPEFPRGGMDTGLFSRRVVDVYRTLPERHSSPIASIYDLGFRQAYVPYERRARERGTSGWPVWKRINTAIDIITGFSYLPIRIMSTVGALFCVAALSYAAVIVYRALFMGLGGEGWPSLAVLVLFIGGVQMIFLGVIAEYLWRTNQELRSRPRYIIVEDYGGDAVARGPRRTLYHLDLNVSDRAAADAE
jgi:dolichol-phosphate mannosyltransferase